MEQALPYCRNVRLQNLANVAKIGTLIKAVETSEEREDVYINFIFFYKKTLA